MQNREKPILLFFPMDMLSHILRCLQLADAVRDIAVCYFATEQYADLVQSRGHRSVSCLCLSADMIIRMGQKGDSSWVSVKYLEPVLLSQVDVIKSIRPDLIVNDYSFTAQLAAEMAGVQCASLINGLFSNQLVINRAVPKSHPMAKFAFLFPRFLISAIQTTIFRRLHSPFRALRKKYGLKQTKRSFLDEFEADWNLILETCEYAPQDRLGDTSVVLGPLYHVDTKIEGKILERLDPRKRTILVNMGSSGLVEKAAFLNDPRFLKYNILVVGKNTALLHGDHVIRADFLSLESVLPNVDLVVTQAGTGNIFQTLGHGIPVFCYPTFFEQEWNAIRLSDLGFGLYLTGRESVNEMARLVAYWSQRKHELKFEMLRGSFSVKQTKERFRRFVEQRLRDEIQLALPGPSKLTQSETWMMDS